jgi:hypothetical protein
VNFNVLAQKIGHKLKLHPPATTWDASLGQYVESDDVWVLGDVAKNVSITLTNERSQQVLALGSDHVHSFTSNAPDDPSFDGFLELKVTVDLTGEKPRIAIIPSGAARMIQRERRPPLQPRIVQLLDRITPEILEYVRTGATGVRVMIGDANLRALNALASEHEFSRWLSIEPTGSVISGGRGNRIGGHLHDEDESAGQQGFALNFTAEMASAVSPNMWRAINRPDEKVSPRFSPTSYAPGDCVWVNEFKVLESRDEGYTHYRGPNTGGAAFREVLSGTREKLVEFLMVRPGANRIPQAAPDESAAVSASERQKFTPAEADIIRLLLHSGAVWSSSKELAARSDSPAFTLDIAAESLSGRGFIVRSDTTPYSYRFTEEGKAVAAALWNDSKIQWSRLPPPRDGHSWMAS